MPTTNTLTDIRLDSYVPPRIHRRLWPDSMPGFHYYLVDDQWNEILGPADRFGWFNLTTA